ncbi:MAG: Gfo/Idh/MocA family oxidoreductase [bacterium]|nr:Gfo/Idh/MocA family oxidoreductase [bacterium]
MNKIRYGVIGLGFFGEKHIEALKTLPQTEVIAVCTRRQSRLEEITKKYNVPYAYTDYNELLANPEVDAVSIVTHINDHLQPTLAAIQAKKHIFLEKPMAASVTECDQIIAALKHTEKFFMVGHICRFDPSYALAKRYIDAGNLGNILSIYARRNIPAKVTEQVLTKISPIVGDGVHDIDIILWFTNAKVKTVYAKTVQYRNLPNPDLGWTMCSLSTGAVAVLENVWCLPDNTPFELDAKMEIIGEKGSIYINSPGDSVAISSSTGWKYPDTVYWPKIHIGRIGALKEELAYFLNCILTNTAPTIITPQESRQAVAIVTAAEESAKIGKEITLVS